MEGATGEGLHGPVALAHKGKERTASLAMSVFSDCGDDIQSWLLGLERANSALHTMTSMYLLDTLEASTWTENRPQANKLHALKD
jgi:hypothetical protein